MALALGLTVPVLPAPAGDFDGDGLADVVWRHREHGRNQIWWGNAEGLGSADKTVLVREADRDWSIAAMGDFDGDGRDDLLWRHGVTGENRIWRSGDQATPLPIDDRADTAWQAAGTGDFNGDRRTDILWHHRHRGRNQLWLGRAKGLGPAARRTLAREPDADWRIAAVGDYDGDGSADILWRHSALGHNRIWRGGEATKDLPIKDRVDRGWQVAGSGDFSRDGRTDILWRHLGDGRTQVWLGSPERLGPGNQRRLARQADLEWQVVGLGDFDGDTRADILWRHAKSGDNQIWLGGDRTQSLPIADRRDLDWKVAPFVPEASSSPGSGALLYPDDLQYRGAFRLPEDTIRSTWGFGGHGMSFYPDGDPGNEDAYPGSLFGVGNLLDGMVSELAIPEPLISPSKNIGDLPVANTLQPFADISGGRHDGTLEGLILRDVQYYPAQGRQRQDKLHWVLYEYYFPSDELGFGWSGLDLSHPRPRGAWRLGKHSTAATNGYLFTIPRAWADDQTPNQYLAAGRSRIVNQGSWGPALFAYGPWIDGNPPADGRRLTATRLLYYPWGDWDTAIDDHTVRDYSQYDIWSDGAWLAHQGRAAVIFAGTKGLRLWQGIEYYGHANVDGCGGKGYHAEPYVGLVMFYDPAMLARVAGGQLEPHQVQPYAILNLEDRLFAQGCRRHILGGVGYDRQNGLLYVLEQEVDRVDGAPLVHVFAISPEGTGADDTPPTAPRRLRVRAASATQVDLAWDAAHDDRHLVGYVLSRYDEPIATTTKTRFRDTKVNPDSTYSYSVAAWDASYNLGSAARIIATTPGSTSDARVPIIANIQYSDLHRRGIRIRWLTDEPATTEFTYGIQYSGEEKTYSDLRLTRRHEAVLTGLTPCSTYFIPDFVSRDAAGNTNEFAVEQWQFTTSCGSENDRPALNGIGSRRVVRGARVTFRLDAFDRDADDTLTFGASGLPPGASLDAKTGEFSWIPATNGRHVITFSVSDGDQTDSEEVVFFVVTGP